MISLAVSTLSLLLSLTVAWLTLLRRGTVRITRPKLVGFLSEEGQPKVFLRALLYATGKRGHIVEDLFLIVRRGEVSQLFGFWMYGERKSEMIGSGLKISEDGVAFNYYFLPPKDSGFCFLSGEYFIKIHAKILNRDKPLVLCAVKLSLSDELAVAFADPSTGVLFTWMPDSDAYRSDLHAAPSIGRSRSVSGAGRGELPWA